MLIRPATPADARGIAILMYESQTRSFADFIYAEWIASRRLEEYINTWEVHFAEKSHEVYYFVCKENDDIIGMMGVQDFETWEYFEQCRPFTTGNASTVGVLRNGHVHPARLRRGIGEQLFAACKAYAIQRGKRTLIADAHIDNARSRNFIEKNGFQMLRVITAGRHADVPYRLQLDATMPDFHIPALDEPVSWQGFVGSAAYYEYATGPLQALQRAEQRLLIDRAGIANPAALSEEDLATAIAAIFPRWLRTVAFDNVLHRLKIMKLLPADYPGSNAIPTESYDQYFLMGNLTPNVQTYNLTVDALIYCQQNPTPAAYMAVRNAIARDGEAYNRQDLVAQMLYLLFCYQDR